MIWPCPQGHGTGNSATADIGHPVSPSEPTMQVDRQTVSLILYACRSVGRRRFDPTYHPVRRDSLRLSRCLTACPYSFSPEPLDTP